ncbi:uncharacterized protein LOC124174012 [Ischnura elegans]|uniref:uncharacterized protein LOC124174012 n=1 Tax=Ischnura elegans TaxID=197161 RepID=UPI001ED8B18F|nr:uncharacterized protein LOC124174012 [Ischnura elegans]
MKTFAVLLAIVAVASAASIMTMDDREFEKMMENLAFRGKMAPLMDIHAFMNEQDEEPQAVEVDGELSDAEEPANDENDDDHRPIITDAAPYTAKQPSNGNNNNNGNRKPAANGNGKRGGGSAAAASATSFSKGANSFASSQAQAFSRGSK